MRKTLRASVLLLALCCPAFAGDIPCPPLAPPLYDVTVQEPTTGGDMPNGEMQNDAADSLTQIALDLLAVLPSLR